MGAYPMSSVSLTRLYVSPPSVSGRRRRPMENVSWLKGSPPQLTGWCLYPLSLDLSYVTLSLGIRTRAMGKYRLVRSVVSTNWELCLSVSPITRSLMRHSLCLEIRRKTMGWVSQMFRRFSWLTTSCLCFLCHSIGLTLLSLYRTRRRPMGNVG